LLRCLRAFELWLNSCLSLSSLLPPIFEGAPSCQSAVPVCLFLTTARFLVWWIVLTSNLLLPSQQLFPTWLESPSAQLSLFFLLAPPPTCLARPRSEARCNARCVSVYLVPCLIVLSPILSISLAPKNTSRFLFSKTIRTCLLSQLASASGGSIEIPTVPGTSPFQYPLFQPPPQAEVPLWFSSFPFWFSPWMLPLPDFGYAAKAAFTCRFSPFCPLPQPCAASPGQPSRARGGQELHTRGGHPRELFVKSPSR